MALERNLATILKLNNLLGFLSIEVEEIVRVVTQEIKKLYPGTCVRFYRHQGDGFYPAHHNCGLVPSTDSHGGDMLLAGVCPAVKDGFPIIVQDKGQGNDCRGCLLEAEVHSYTCLPIKAADTVVALLVVAAPEKQMFKQQDLEMLLAMANLAGLALQRNELIQKLIYEKNQLEQANREIQLLNKSLESRYRELREYEKTLIQSERLAAAGQLAAEMAHEINNPVSIILSRLECVQDDLLENQAINKEELLEDLKVLKKHAARIATTTQRLLSFSRTSDISWDVVDLNALATEALHLLGRQLSSRQISLELDLAPDLSSITGNGQQLQQVLINLLHNARDAMPEGGRITIKTRNVGTGFVEMAVIDTGIGIKSEHQAMIFDPFVTTKEIGKGTGLGLAICRGIIKEHYGTIRVQSKPEQGSAFTILLPLATADQQTNGVNE